LDAKGSDPKTWRYFWRRYIWHRCLPRLFYSIQRVKQSQTLRRIKRNARIRFPELCLLSGKKRLRFVLLNSPALCKMIGAQLARRLAQSTARDDGLEARRFAKALANYPLYRMARLRYHYRPFAGRIAVVANAEWCSADSTLGWPRLARGGLEVHEIPGNHDTYITQNVRAVAHVLRECLLGAKKA